MNKMLIMSMAMSRSLFVDKLHNALNGAYGEWLCSYIARRVHLTDVWAKEVQQLMLLIEELLSDRVKVKIRDKSSSVSEAVLDFKVDNQSVIRRSKNKMINYFPKKTKLIDQLELTDELTINAFLNSLNLPTSP